MLGTAFSFHGAIPFFGIFLNGLPGMLVYFIFALIMGYAAWAMYKLDPLGWWALFAIMCITPISATLTYWHHDIMELYRLAGYSAKEMQAIQQFNFFKGSGMMWFTLLSVLPWLVYLLYVRKFFRRAS